MADIGGYTDVFPTNGNIADKVRVLIAAVAAIEVMTDTVGASGSSLCFFHCGRIASDDLL